MKRHSVENIAIKSVRADELKRRRDKAKEVVEKAAAPLLEDDDLQVFAEYYGKENPKYSKRQIEKDLRFVDRRRAELMLDNTRDLTLPHAVEFLMKKWLDGGQFFEREGLEDDEPLATRTHDYDDFIHGADLIKTLNLPEAESEAVGQRTLTLAFDVTMSNRGNVIGNKLRQFRNGLPYGFTKIKYYAAKMPENPTKFIAPGKGLVPRFVVGIDVAKVEGVLKGWTEEGVEEESADTVLTKFKLLSEIYAQANLFLNKLPDREDTVSSKAESYLRAVCAMAEQRLAEYTQKMSPKMTDSGGEIWKPTYDEPEIPALSESELESLEDVENVGEAARTISDLMRNPESSVYDRTYAAIMEQVEKIDGDNPGKMPALERVSRW